MDKINLLYHALQKKNLGKKCASSQGRLDEYKIFHLAKCDINNVVNKEI
jgi:hypothetical protein